MDMETSKSRRERSIEMRDQDDSPARERWEEGHDNLEESGVEKTRDSGRHRSKDRSKSSRRDEKEPKSRDRDRERSKTSDVSKDREKDSRDLLKDSVPSKDKRAEDRDDRERDKGRDKAREKDSDREKYRVKERESEKDHKDRGRKRERERERDSEKDGEREREKERGKEKNKEREKEKDRDGAKDRGKEKDRDRHKERENDRDTREKLEKEKVKDRSREERETDQKKERSHERDKASRKQRDEEHHRNKDVGKDENTKLHGEDGHYRDITKQGLGSHHNNNSNGNFKHEEDEEGEPSGSRRSAVELEERILKMKEERLKKKSEGSSEVLSWVSKSRKLEEKRNNEKEKALQLSRIFEEQDNIQGESEDESSAEHTAKDLAGVKILHGLDKVVEGGAVVLTLKDQSILADGDINQEVDMLENIEIGEQKRRTEAYGAAKKKTGTYVDKFNEEPGSEKKMLPQYDDPNVDEGVTLDARGRFSGEAEKKLEELRRRIDGVTTKNQFEDLNSSTTVSSDYFTHEEMLQFKKPKKKKSLRKKNKLDLDALEAEAIASGLGAGDLGSRNDAKRQALKEEQERSAAEKRSNAYQSAYEKADEASKALRLEKNLPVPMEEDDTPIFGDDDDDLRKSLERARKLSLRKQEEGAASGPQSIALLASTTGINSTAETEKPTSGESQENKVVFTEMEEFVWGLQLDEESHKPDGEDVFMEEDVAPRAPSQEPKEEDGGWAELNDTSMGEASADPDKEEVTPDETVHEVAVGKGLAGALDLLKGRGALKETVEWGGRNMDKKKSKLVGIYANDGQKEIRIDRTDEYGRILTPKEAFRLLSHKFHGKGPGKMKQEKRMRQYQEELKIKKMKNADTPSSSAERMRETQAQLKMPYLVISGSVKPGQTSDPRSGFATVEKDFAGGLTPMLGDRKVEHFLGIKRKPEGGDMGPPKKPGGGDMGPPKLPKS